MADAANDSKPSRVRTADKTTRIRTADGPSLSRTTKES